ncbi:1,4-dihydroxy-2-naphthoate polyprenyltransferase [Rhodohalobacter sp. SW132]|uniref:1,4-dihydroxy-2-naphthoate polyprenyltransferase n=1 Tax=Rhodohalobacter sp. SW132 TaxID=2293433 RepID=UPI000E27B107|nr:1,4-dihydroxy-2-naphthoate polyprenyltransferase [Rhodohalobacter sp. SW132]REL24086.1 1,4-dihydroxy-2-naphthoate polyprenyltransferase [Rhodohalobacter sp. SW132]
MKKNKIELWLSASRPKTLAAAVVPVLTGAAIAWNHQLFRFDTTFVALFCALTIQVGTNFANDYFDFIKGADTDERLGFERATAAGLITPKAMRNATIAAMLIAFFAGLYLVWIGGWVVLLIGLLSLLFGVLYTGGPYPLGYNGLGDLFVFIFFGIVAVTGTYYVNALSWSVTSFWASIPVGALCVNILVVNNLRDIEQDRAANKRTLGVLFGENMLKAEYTAMLVLSYLSLSLMHVLTDASGWIYLAYLTLFPAYKLNQTIWTNIDKKELNDTLAETARLMMMFGFLLAAAFIIDTYV